MTRRAPSAASVDGSRLFERADAARAAGRPIEAARFLETIVESPTADRATRGQAALELGLLYTEALDEPEKAKHALELAMQSDLPPALVRRASELLRVLTDGIP